MERPSDSKPAAMTPAAQNIQDQAKGKASRDKIPPLAPNTSSQRPCEHNNWDNVRVKKGHITLRCRDCQLQWKTETENIRKCPQFFADTCARGVNCPMPHIHRFKLGEKERREIWGDQLLVPKPADAQQQNTQQKMAGRPGDQPALADPPAIRPALPSPQLEDAPLLDRRTSGSSQGLVRKMSGLPTTRQQSSFGRPSCEIVGNTPALLAPGPVLTSPKAEGPAKNSTAGFLDALGPHSPGSTLAQSGNKRPVFGAMMKAAAAEAVCTASLASSEPESSQPVNKASKKRRRRKAGETAEGGKIRQSMGRGHVDVIKLDDIAYTSPSKTDIVANEVVNGPTESPTGEHLGISPAPARRASPSGSLAQDSTGLVLMDDLGNVTDAENHSQCSLRGDPECAMTVNELNDQDLEKMVPTGDKYVPESRRNQEAASLAAMNAPSSIGSHNATITSHPSMNSSNAYTISTPLPNKGYLQAARGGGLTSSWGRAAAAMESPSDGGQSRSTFGQSPTAYLQQQEMSPGNYELVPAHMVGTPGRSNSPAPHFPGPAGQGVSPHHPPASYASPSQIPPLMTPSSTTNQSSGQTGQIDPGPQDAVLVHHQRRNVPDMFGVLGAPAVPTAAPPVRGALAAQGRAGASTEHLEAMD